MDSKLIYAVIIMLIMLLPCACVKAEPQKPASQEGTSGEQSTVWFTNEISPQAVSRIYAKLSGELNGKIAIKLHFGEEGNQNFLPASLIKDLCLNLDATLVETNVLYGGPRSKTASHIALARKHGFDFAPIDILDDEANLAFEARGKHFSKVYTGSHFTDYDGYLIFSHVKGHGNAGFGGAIKNIAMGLASREGKRFQHQGNYPVYDSEKCISCGICVSSCPGSAITIDPVNIDHTACIACGKCISVCPVKVFSQSPGGRSAEAFQERLVEYAKVLSSQRKMVYINVLANISSACDCMSHSPKPFVKDIGILASTDIVAIEAASYDLVNKAHNCEDAFLKESRVSGRHQIDYAQAIGMGHKDYKLVDIDAK